MKIRVLIADDQPIIRYGLRTLLNEREEFAVVGEAADCREALEICQKENPDILLLDIDLPGSEISQFIHSIHTRSTGTKIIILTSEKISDQTMDTLRAGAGGWLSKSENTPRFFQAIQDVAQGKCCVDATTAGILVDYVRGIQQKEALYQELSRREVEVLERITQGDTNPQIAEALSISLGTVKRHVSALYEKLNIHNRAEVVAWMWRNQKA